MAYRELGDGRLDVEYLSNELTDEQRKVWNEALFKSKGKSNTKLGVRLVIAGATANEVVKFTSKVFDGKWEAKQPQHKKHRAERALDQILKRVPNYWETAEGKKIKEEYADTLAKLGVDVNKNLPVTRVDMKRSKFYWAIAERVTGYTYCALEGMTYLQRDASVGRKLVAAKTFAPLANVKFGSPLDNPLQRLMDSTGEPQDDKFADYDECRKFEIESLANVDADVVSKVDPYELMCDVIRANFSRYWRGSVPEWRAKSKIELDCLIEAFYAVCREMGIVGVVDYNINARTYVSEAASKGIMKNIIKLSGTYRRLVKSGFAESVARETVLGEINNNIASRASRTALRFYGRTDYEDTPAEEREKAKKVSTRSGSGGSRKRTMTLEEFAKANGIEKEEAENE